MYRYMYVYMYVYICSVVASSAARLFIGVPTSISHRFRSASHGISRLNPSKSGRYQSFFGSLRVGVCKSCLFVLGRVCCLFGLCANVACLCLRLPPSGVIVHPKVCKHTPSCKYSGVIIDPKSVQAHTNNANSSQKHQKSKKGQHSVLFFKVFGIKIEPINNQSSTINNQQSTINVQQCQ